MKIELREKKKKKKKKKKRKISQISDYAITIEEIKIKTRSVNIEEK